MSKQPTIDVLLNRFRQETQSVFYQFLVVSIIDEIGPTTRKEILDALFKRTCGAFEIDAASHKRMIARLEKTFRLIEPAEKERDSDRVRYVVTEKGRRLLHESLHEVVYPLVGALPEE